MTETRSAYRRKLEALCADVVRLGALCIEAVNAGTDVLLAGDLAGTEAVVSGDLVLDELAHLIEERTYEVLALQQPMAVDLRVLVSILRIAHELERVGDLMVNIAKAARRLYPYRMEPEVRGLVHRMREQAVEQLRLAIDVFAGRDPARAAALPDMDDTMDDLQKELFRRIFAVREHEDGTVQRAVQVALVGRYFERIADHAVNCGERVAYMVTGEFPPGESSALPAASAAPPAG